MQRPRARHQRARQLLYCRGKNSSLKLRRRRNSTSLWSVIGSATRSNLPLVGPNLCLESFDAAHAGAPWGIVAFKIQDRSEIS